jgi:hypothetical protein
MLEPVVRMHNRCLVGAGHEQHIAAASEHIAWRGVGWHAHHPSAHHGRASGNPPRERVRRRGRQRAPIGPEQFHRHLVSIESHKRSWASAARNFIGHLRGPQAGVHGQVADEHHGEWRNLCTSLAI